MDAWLSSCRKHFTSAGYRLFPKRFPFGRKVVEFDQPFYRCEGFDEKAFRRARAEHEAKVERYFSDQRHNLLRYDVCGGEGWGPLCEFLGRDEPAEAFPNTNASKKNASKK